MKNTVAVIIVVMIAVLFGIFLVYKTAPGNPNPASPQNPEASPAPSADNNSSNNPINTFMVQDMKVEVLKEGTGAVAKNGDTVSVNYVGTLTDGTKFDSSQAFSFSLGAGQVIKGWDLGVAGMKIGEKRRLTIPADLGYGAGGRGPIPPNATMIFEVELLGINQ